jgi:hypothetical protein
VTAFHDHFSAFAGRYADFRPSYPAELFDYLAGLTPKHELAWDCAAGNGQATVGLAGHFDRVVATDASREQIASARPHPKIAYWVAPAESSESIRTGQVAKVDPGPVKATDSRPEAARRALAKHQVLQPDPLGLTPATPIKCAKLSGHYPDVKVLVAFVAREPEPSFSSAQQSKVKVIARYRAHPLVL